MTVLNHLALIKDQIVRDRALSDAQIVTLKAYRGVPYTVLPREAQGGADLVYRGVDYRLER